MKHLKVMNKNLQVLATRYQELEERSLDVPGMGAITGPTGTGKTTGITWLINRVNGVYVRALQSWSPSAMLDAILREVGNPPINRNTDKVEHIVKVLTEDRRPLFVDEGDSLLKNLVMLETLRDIHDLSSMPVIVVGMEGFDVRLAQRKQFARRVLQWIQFTPLDMEDTRDYVAQVSDIRIADDLVVKLHKETKGVIGRMAVAIELFENYAKSRLWKELTAEQWGDRQMVFTRAPKVAG